MNLGTLSDPQLVEKIVHEVKSQGVFDEFRKDLIADVDTKPAYQNLRQRVDTAVQKFLDGTHWTPETNKNQLRERLRKHITESSFLDIGVERIVDQVVNPKINSVFRPRIEEIAYKYVGIPPPPKTEPSSLISPYPPLPLGEPGEPLKVDTSSLLPADLEQISPDSDRATVKSDCKDDLNSNSRGLDQDTEEHESPPFEPMVEASNQSKVTPDDAEMLPTTDSQMGSASNGAKEDLQLEALKADVVIKEEKLCVGKVEPMDMGISQESQLSRISSTSRLSYASQDTSQSGAPKTANTALQGEAEATISEEAQMPKFSDNSNEVLGSLKDLQLHFDIKKDAITFEGTNRSRVVGEGEENSDGERSQLNGSAKNVIKVEAPPTSATQESSFGSSLDDSTSKAEIETKVEVKKPPTPPPTGEKSAAKHGSSSSSSRHKHSRHRDHHKKSSRDHDRSKDRSKEKDKEKDHSKDRSKDGERSKNSDRSKERSKHHSESSKHSSGHKSSEASSATSGKHERKHASSSAKHSTPSSSRSSSRSENPKHESRSDKKHSSKSSSGQSSKAPKDDHYESKSKPQKRKSTDSNDDDQADKSGSAKPSTTEGPSAPKAKAKDGESKSSHHSRHRSESSRSKDGSKSSRRHRTKVVILNDILHDPATNFIELGAKSKSVHVAKRCELSDEEGDVTYLEGEPGHFSDRLQMLNTAIANCRAAINDQRRDRTRSSNATPSPELNAEEAEKMSVLEGVVGAGRTPTKRFKQDTNGGPKSSPTSSDVSINSKENEGADKSSGVRQRCGQGSKLSQQRYDSEDLYKPRRVLSQRSRRRGADLVSDP